MAPAERQFLACVEQAQLAAVMKLSFQCPCIDPLDLVARHASSPAAQLPSGGPDVRTLHVIQVPALNTYQLREPVSLRRMDYTNIVEVAIARFQDISLGRLDQCRLVTFAFPDNAPVGHL